jgi:hypothetical protein
MPPDGIYLCDSFRGNEGKRSLLFYDGMQPGANDFRTPDAIVDLDVVRSDGTLNAWETGTTQCA